MKPKLSYYIRTWDGLAHGLAPQGEAPFRFRTRQPLGVGSPCPGYNPNIVISSYGWEGNRFVVTLNIKKGYRCGLAKSRERRSAPVQAASPRKERGRGQLAESKFDHWWRQQR